MADVRVEFRIEHSQRGSEDDEAAARPQMSRCELQFSPVVLYVFEDVDVENGVEASVSRQILDGPGQQLEVSRERAFAMLSVDLGC
jgi:hypothetical protein